MEGDLDKSFMNYFKNALICTIVLGVLCSVVYPAALTLAGQAFFPETGKRQPDYSSGGRTGSRR